MISSFALEGSCGAPAGAMRRQCLSIKPSVLSIECFWLGKCLVLSPFIVWVACFSSAFANSTDVYPEPERAFMASAKYEDSAVIAITYRIADGYYMYRERFKFELNGATAGNPTMPPGATKFDKTLGKHVEIFRNAVTIRLPVTESNGAALKVTGQGCADSGLCYPPLTSEINLLPIGNDPSVPLLIRQMGDAAIVGSSSSQSAAGAQPAASPDRPGSDERSIEESLRSGRWSTILPLFFLLGLGLSFTPCVLPMVPILSCIIVGEGAHTSRGRGLALSATYSLGMSLVYTLLGIFAGLIGEGLAAAMQTPWVLVGFSALMIVMALSMFNFYQLQIPTSMQEKLMQISKGHAGGKWSGVFVMGALSGLIIGPCVAAPLAGALLYISQTRDVAIGGGALFALAAGMSVPLLLVGASAGFVLPRAGQWMEVVKQFFGVLMLAMAHWTLSPIMPPWVQMIIWAGLGIGYGLFLLRARSGAWLSKASGVGFVLVGILELAGLANGARDPLTALAQFGGAAEVKTDFKRINSIKQLDLAISEARGSKVMLDFYADWCVSCKEMEKFTFSDQRVRQKLEGIVLLQVDVTANDFDGKQLLRRFNLFGPPGIIFFDKTGKEIRDSRVIGFESADKFVKSLAFVVNL